MSRTVQTPALPLPQEGNLLGFCNAVKQILDLREGRSKAGQGSQAVTFLDLEAYNQGQTFGGLIGSGSRSEASGSGGSNTVPPCTNLIVTTQAFHNHLSWTNPAADDFYYTEVWYTSDDLGAFPYGVARSYAERLAVVTRPDNSYDHTGIDTETTHYYWIRAYDVDGNYSVWEPPDTQGGAVAPAIMASIEDLLARLDGNIGENHLVQSLADKIYEIRNETQIAQLIAANGTVTAIAQTANQAYALAQNEIKGFYQIAAPTVGMVYGDIWIDTDRAEPLDTSCIYRYENATSHDATAPLDWTLDPDSAMGQVFLNSYLSGSVTGAGATIFTQANDPGAAAAPGDLWIETDNNYRMFQKGPSGWVEVTDRHLDQTVSLLQSEMALSSNQFTVKIQSTAGGVRYATGFGLLLYPPWASTSTYVLNETVRRLNGAAWQVYRSLANNNSNRDPLSQPAWWVLLPDEAVSSFVVMADKFQILQPDQGLGTPRAVFTVGLVDGVAAAGLHGNMIIDGMLVARMIKAGEIKATHVDANAILTSSLKSHGYDGGNGFYLDSVTNRFYLRNWSMLISGANDAPTAGADKTSSAIGSVPASSFPTTLQNSYVTKTSVGLGNVDNTSDATVLASAAGQNHTGQVQGYTLISGGKINTGLVVANSIVAGSITATQIAANTITAANIAADTITSTQIAANAITASELSAGAVTAAKITAATITATEINGLARINGNKLNYFMSAAITVSWLGSAWVNHNLGRVGSVCFAGPATDSNGEPVIITTEQTANAFRFFRPGTTISVSGTYVFM